MRLIRAGWLGALAVALIAPLSAHAALTVTPVTWNIVGLDSNSPASGPRYFPVGARVCSTIAAASVTANWVWDSANANINLRAGSPASINLGALAAGACADAYFEVDITQTAAAFDTTRRYHIAATDGANNGSTPMPRELYVEHLISQNRNAITDVKLDGVSIPNGGAMNLVVGNTYTIELDGGTAVQGYNQFESFINFPNTIFRILSVSTTYSADNSPWVPGPAPIASDKFYADACLWQNDPASPNYRSCVGGDYKAGGTDVRTTYTVTIIGGGGTSQTLNTLLYDFSGSSYHYNSDFAAGTRIANIIDPTALTIAKAFAPTPTVAGGTSTLTFTISNPTAGAVSGANFTDPLPLLSGGQMVVASPATYSASGCGTPTFAPVAGATSVSFSNGTVAAGGNCVVSVRVAVPALPTSGTYSNTSNHLFIGSVDTGHQASASLGLTTTGGGSSACGLTLAQWTMPTNVGTGVPPLYSFKATDVATAISAAGAGITSSISTTIGNPINSWQASGWSTSASLNTGNNDYFEFSATTTNYTNITFSFDARRDAGLLGPDALQLYSSTDGVTFTPYGSALGPTGAFTTFNPAFTNPANASGNTYFRIYGYHAANSGVNALLFIDNITIGGCQTAQPPTITKSFSPSPVAVGGTSTLTFTLTNPNGSTATGVKFSDSLPAGVQVAGAPAAATTCGGSPTWAPAPGATTLDFGQVAGATIPAGGSCTASVNVVVTTAGPHTNVSGFVSSTEGGTNTGGSGSAVSSVTALLPPSIGKTFGTSPIVVNGTSLLTFTLTNPNPSDALSGVAFADTYPAGVVNVSPLSPPVVNTCGGAVTAVAGGNGISLAGGTLAGGASCTVSVTVTSAVAGSYPNTSGAVSAAVAGPGNTASATLVVVAPSPAISVNKQIGTSPTGPWYKYIAVAPGTSIYYKFTAENVGDVTLATFNVTDPLLAGTGADPATCVWQTSNVPSTLPTLPVASPTLDPTATCVTGPVAAVLGDHVNTALAHGTYSGTTYDSAPSSAEYLGAVPGFSLLKQISSAAAGPWSSAITVAAGTNVWYKFTLVNTGGLDLNTISVTDPTVSTASCTFTDPLVVGNSTICVVGPVVAAGAPGTTTTNTAVGHGTNGGTVYNTPPSSASYTIPAADADLAIAKTDGVASVVAGTVVTYTIVASNAGPSAVVGATVTDTLPASLSGATWTCVGAGGGTCPASGSGNISASVNLPVGGTATFTLAATLSAAATGTLSNTATIAPPAGINDPVPGNNSATDTDTITLQADLAITKTDGVASAVPGAPVTYTIVASNSGPSNVTGAAVTDTLPASLSGATWTCAGAGGGICPASGSGNISASVDLPVGASVTFTLTATLSAAATGTLVNTATVAPPGGVTDPNPGNNSATDTDTITPTADLSITKTDGIASAVPGSPVTYTIVASNSGPSNVTGASVADTLPASLSGATWTCAPSGGAACPASGVGNISASVDLPVGSSVAFTLTATLSAAATGTLSNTATIAPPGGVTDPNPGNNSSTDTDTITPTADLAITKTDGVASVVPGTPVTYTIVASNAGPSNVTGATVSDTLPASLSGATWTCVPAGGAACPAAGVGNINATVDLPVGGTATFTLTATLSAGATGTLSNTATIAPPGGVTDPNPGNNSATDTDTISAQADLAITKTDGSATAVPGSPVTYTIVASNAGPSAVTGATVTDTLPASLSGSTWTCVGAGGGTCTAAGSGNIADTVNLPVGATVTYTLTATLSAGATGTLINTATIAPPAGVTDPNPGNNAATDADAIVPQVSLAVAKTDGSATYTPGGTATYTITVTNGGPSSATSVTLTDALPAGVTLSANATCVASGTASCGTVTGTTGQTSFGTTGATIPAGGGNNLVFTAPVAFAAGMTTDPLVNTATATDVPSGATASGSDSDTRSAAVTLAVTKTDGSASYTPGGTATYTVTVANTGTSDATAVTVTDPLPAGVTLTGAVVCVANGTSSCGTVTGIAGQTSFGTTGAVVGAGGANTLVFTVPVAFAPGMVANPLVNTASATDSVSGASASGSDSDTRSLAVTLAVAKTDGSASYTPGGTATYTVTVTNGGTSDALGITVNDPLPAGVTLTGTVTCVAAGAATCGTVSGIAGQTTFGTTGATIPAGGGNNLVFTAPVAFAPGLATDPLVNVATATDVPSGATGADSDSDARAAQVTLTVTKTDGSTTYVPGGTATYTIVVGNTGTSNALNVTVTDALPAGVTLTANVTCIAAGAASCGTVTGSTGQTSFGTTGAAIAAGPGNTLTFTAPVAFASSLVDDPLVNAVSVADVASGASGSATDSDARAAVASLAVVKTDGSATYVPGGTATYTVTVTNGGPSDALNVTVSDSLPAGVTLTANATCVAAGSANCGTVTGTTGQTSFATTGARVGAGAGNSLTFTAPVAFAAGMITDPLVNTTTATDPASPPASGSDSDARGASVSLAVTKTDGSAMYVPGGTATYTVVVTDTGVSDAVNVTVSDPLPAGVALTGTVTCVAGGTSTCGTVTGIAGQTSFGTTGAHIVPGVGNSLTFTAPVAFAAGMTTNPLVNTATATDVASGATASGSDSDALAGAAVLTVTKTDGSATYTPGGTATYVVVVGNAGASDANAVTVSDPLPAGVTLTANATCVAAGSANCGTVTGTTGQTSFGTTGAHVGAGAGNTLTFTAQVAFAAGLSTNPLVNTVTVTDPASPPASASDSDALAGPTVADLTIVKSGPAQVPAGGAITWLLSIGNLGPASANGATFSDPLPAGVSGVVVSCGSAAGGAACGPVSYVGGVVNGTVAVLPMGGSVVITIQAVAPMTAGVSLANTATIATPVGITDPSGNNNSSSSTTVVQAGVAVTPVPVDARWALAMLMLLIGAAAARRLRPASRR